MNLHKSHRMGRTMLNGIAKGQTPKLNTGTRRQASDLCPNVKVSYHADNAGGAHEKDTNDK